MYVVVCVFMTLCSTYLYHPAAFAFAQVCVCVFWISSITIVSCNAQQNSSDVQALHKSNPIRTYALYAMLS